MTATIEIIRQNGQSASTAPRDDPAVNAFILDVLDVARSVAPALVDIIGAPEAPDHDRNALDRKSWTGDRRRGLALCASMLTYARQELATGDDRFRIDLGIGYVTAELAALDGKPAAQPN